MPAGAAVYVEAAVQPTGDRREDALAAAGKLLRTDDPAGKLRELIDKALAEEGDGFTWEKDFAPWLGEDAGVWVSNLAADEPELRGDRRDEGRRGRQGRARASSSRPTRHRVVPKRSHDGVDYEVDEEGTASASSTTSWSSPPRPRSSRPST